MRVPERASVTQQVPDGADRDRAMEAAGRMASEVAAELGDVLTVALSSTERVAKQLRIRNPEQLEAFEELQGAVRRGAEVVGRLLSIAPAEPKGLSPLDLVEVVESVSSTLRAVVPSDVELVVASDATSHAWIRGDRSALQQILLNLVTNARDAMPGPGRLTVRVEGAGGGRTPAQGGSVRLIVDDHGTGMDPEVRARAFDPFFTTKRGASSTGLGLSIVYELVRQHGGALALASEPGVGTKVEILFPVHERDGGSKDGATERRGASSAGRRPARRKVNVASGTGEVDLAGRRVVIIEDDPALRRLIGRILTEAGIEAFPLSDREEASYLLARCGSETDLVIVDRCPAGAGAQRFVEPVRDAGFSGPILLLGGEDHEAVRNGGRGDSLYFLAKPWSASGFLQRVSEALKDC